MYFFVRRIRILFRLRRRCALPIIISLIFLLFNYNNYNQKSNSVIPISFVRKINLKQGLWPLDEKGRSLKTNFLAFDLTGISNLNASEGDIINCASSNTTFSWTQQLNRQEEVDFFVAHGVPESSGFLFDRKILNENKQQYAVASIMESEVHSAPDNSWSKYDFKMSYQLDNSYPEPATYFDINTHILNLLKSPKVPFEEKQTQADIVWIISNCNTHNGREGFVQRLMEEIKIDSYGSCLNNRQGYSSKTIDIIDLYAKYKFVIAIENSNCMDYVTEKLVKTLESGSIPIVADQNNRPDYQRFMPPHSYINIFDYPSIKALADDLKRIATNKALYELYLWYKRHNKNLTELKNLPLNENIRHLKDVIGENATMITEGIIRKETSENNICKLIRFVRETSWKDIAEHKKTARAASGISCLPPSNILLHFNAISSNIIQTIKL